MNIQLSVLRILDTKDLEKVLLSFETIGERLKYLREEYAKIPPTSFARQLGITKAMEHKYENNQFIPKIERLRQFAAFYDIPEEYITGESADMLLKEDYFLISNLQHFCWNISFGYIPITNPNKIEIELYNACKIVLNAFKQTTSSSNDYHYIKNLFSEDKDFSMLDVADPDSFIAFFDKKINYLNENITNQTKHLLHLVKALEYSICTQDIISKKEFNQILETIPMLLMLFEQYERQTVGQ